MSGTRAIETARLRLAPLTEQDIAAFHALMVVPQVRRYLLDDQVMPRDWAEAVIADSAASFEARGWGLWGVRLREMPALVGITGFREFFRPPELQLLYALHPDLWRLGLATEAAAAVMRFGIECLGMAGILASADAPNAASIAVMRRLGLRFSKRMVRDARELIYYGIEAADWRLSKDGPG